MTLIADTDRLKILCDELNEQPFICVDTEFIRERTYWPKLCLVQVSDPDGRPFAIDPLSNNIDLSPLFALMTNPKITKVLHAAHQDIEIFLHLTGQLPHPYSILKSRQWFVGLVNQQATKTWLAKSRMFVSINHHDSRTGLTGLWQNDNCNTLSPMSCTYRKFI